MLEIVFVILFLLVIVMMSLRLKHAKKIKDLETEERVRNFVYKMESYKEGDGHI